jgi:hypothetical protein
MNLAIRAMCAVLLGAAAACSGEAPVPSIPAETITLGGAAFDAYQAPGATFRIVCQKPCPVPAPDIFALHAGMTRAKEALVALAGLDVLPAAAPVDVHITADQACAQFTTLAGYSTVGPDSRGYLCLFTWEWSHPPKPYVAEPIDDKLEHQMLFVHEYSHVLFFGRHEVSWESVVRAISYRVTGFIVDPCDSRLTAYAARLVRELCMQDGFSYADLALSLQALDAIYQAGGGEADPVANMMATPKPPTSVYQWRRLLDQRLGKPTLKVFMDADEVSYNRLGDSVTIMPGGGRFELYRGALVLDVPAGAVPAPLEVTARSVSRLGSAGLVAGWEEFAFTTVEDLEPRTATFAQPVTLSVVYDARRLPAGRDPQTLRLLAGSDPMSMAVVSGSTTDVAAATVRGSIGGLGYFFIGPQP